MGVGGGGAGSDSLGSPLDIPLKQLFQYHHEIYNLINLTLLVPNTLYEQTMESLQFQLQLKWILIEAKHNHTDGPQQFDDLEG
jgi:hypothetical protein